MSFLDSLKKLAHKSDETSDNMYLNEASAEEDSSGSIETAEEAAPEDNAKTIKGRLVQIGAGTVAAVAVVAVLSNIMSSPQKQEKASVAPDLSINTNANNPAANLPDSYKDIAKYEKQVNPRPAQQAQQQPLPSASQPTNTSATNYPQQPYYAATAQPSYYPHESVQAEMEKAKIYGSPISFDGLSKSQTESMSMPVYTAAVNSHDTGFTLNAGTVIPATLLTGITSDVSKNDVVAQVRQDVYDSLTGTHLLIPQGSRIIGVSGSAGSRGNKRIGVAFKRIIFPSGKSVNLPDQPAIDGTGYPGLADKYDDHSSTLYRTAFLSALFAAAAQSATGNSNGYDNRSPGEEAVAGAVASVMDTAQTLVERDANISPTIEIQPGFQFSVFINKDFVLEAYYD